MFTGIIEEQGIIKRQTPMPGGKRITIAGEVVLDDLQVDQSVCVDGVCLTVVDLNNSGFSVEAVGETLTKTTIGNLMNNQEVNLERALRLSDRLGGHIVQGHVNDMAPVTRMEQRGDNWYIEVHISDKLNAYVIEEGSIALNGISLTIARLEGIRVGISVIPHTYHNTNIKNWKMGQHINVETDFFARYIEKMLQPDRKTMNEDWFKKMGY